MLTDAERDKLEKKIREVCAADIRDFILEVATPENLELFKIDFRAALAATVSCALGALIEHGKLIMSKVK